MRNALPALALLGAAWLLAGRHSTPAQDDPPDTRLDQLERRVERLERLAGLDPGLTLAQAEARLAAAERQLRHAERLHRKGYITTMELHADRLAALAARRQVELARDPPADPQALLELDVLQAEYQLALARELLERDRRLAAKGLVTEAQLRADELAVERARADLDRGKAKLAPREH